MSLSWSGMTKETVGRFSKSPGKAVNGRLTLAGRWLRPAPRQSTHGACLRKEAPAESPVNPANGKPSEKPTKLRPRARSAVPRLGLVKVVGGLASEVTPWFAPENRNR